MCGEKNLPRAGWRGCCVFTMVPRPPGVSSVAVPFGPLELVNPVGNGAPTHPVAVPVTGLFVFGYWLEPLRVSLGELVVVRDACPAPVNGDCLAVVLARE